MTTGSQNETAPDWAEREYNPRLAVPDAPAIYARWPDRAASMRAAHPPLADIRYGDHPREIVDLFRAENARGTVVFWHGGYWRAFSKDDFSWVAEAFLRAGLSVAVPSYPLCPDVPLARIVDSARACFAHLHGAVLTDRERGRIAVTGHSAGGYLTALHLATDWTAYGLPRDPLTAAVPISGVFRLAPLIATTMNDAIRLDEAGADALTLGEEPALSRSRFTLAVGADESAEFHRQSDRLAADWSGLGPTTLDIVGRNHFDVIDDLADPSSRLCRAILDPLAD